MSFLKVILNGKGEGPHDMQFFSDTNEEKLSNLLFHNYFWVTFLKIHCSFNLFYGKNFRGQDVGCMELTLILNHLR